jgi:hypothetical protein
MNCDCAESTEKTTYDLNAMNFGASGGRHSSRFARTPPEISRQTQNWIPEFFEIMTLSSRCLAWVALRSIPERPIALSSITIVWMPLL